MCGTRADSRIPVVCCDRWNGVVGMQGEQGSSQGTLIINVLFSAVPLEEFLKDLLGCCE